MKRFLKTKKEPKVNDSQVVMRILCFNPEVWKQLNPEEDFYKWQNSNYSHSLSQNALSFLDSYCKNSNISKISKIQFITIDKEYLKFLEENELKDSELARSEYMIDEEKAEELLVKNQLNKDYKLMFLGITILLKDSGDPETKEKKICSLSKETIAYFTEKLSEHFGKVWFPGYVISQPDTVDDIVFSRLISMGKSYFEENTNINVEKYKEIEMRNYEGLSMNFSFIPFMVEGSIKKACITVKELLKNEEELECPLNLDKYKVSDMLAHDFDSLGALVCDYPLYDTDTFDYIYNTIKIFKKK